MLSLLETELTLTLQYKGRPCLLSDFSHTVPRIWGARSSPKKDYGDSLQGCIEVSVPEIFLPRSTCQRALQPFWRGGCSGRLSQREDIRYSENHTPKCQGARAMLLPWGWPLMLSLFHPIAVKVITMRQFLTLWWAKWDFLQDVQQSINKENWGNWMSPPLTGQPLHPLCPAAQQNAFWWGVMDRAH